jgi:2-methylcitrate dehydratase PrpD
MTPHPSLLTWLVNQDPGQLADAHLAQAKRCLLDLLGVAAAATRTPLADKARRFVLSQYPGTRPLLFAEGGTSPSGAALHGAWLIDALDAHDGQVLTKGHAGVALLPGLLALPQAEKLSGREWLGLLAMGYEVATRAGMALHATSPDYHTSGAWNALGVAAMAGRLLRLDAPRLHHALGIAEFYGPRSQMMRCIDSPTMLKDGSGWGALAGVSAALLAKDGFTGAPALTVSAPNVAPIWADLGQRWYIHEQYFKPYPVCRWAQPAVEAVRSLRDAVGDPSRIRRIEIVTFHEAKRLHTVHPRTTEEAQYSLPWAVAGALLSGGIDVETVTTALGDAKLKALAERVEILESEAFNRRFPHERWATARLHLADGRVVESEPREARGDAHSPLSDEALHTKFLTLAEPVLGDDAQRLVEVVSRLERLPAAALWHSLRTPCPAALS